MCLLQRAGCDPCALPLPPRDAGGCWTSRAHHFSPTSPGVSGEGDFPVCEAAVGSGAAPGPAQWRGTAHSWKGLGQRVRLSVKAKDRAAAAGAWKVNFCSRATKKMKSSVLASCSPGQALLPGKGAQISRKSPERAAATSEHPPARGASHRLRQLFFLERLGGNVHPHNLLKPSPEVYCRANCACSERRRAETV